MTLNWKSIIGTVIGGIILMFVGWGSSQLWTRNEQVTTIVQQVTASQKQIVEVVRDIKGVTDSLQLTTNRLTELSRDTYDLKWSLYKVQKTQKYLIKQQDNLAFAQEKVLRDHAAINRSIYTRKEIDNIFALYNKTQTEYQKAMEKIDDELRKPER